MNTQNTQNETALRQVFQVPTLNTDGADNDDFMDGMEGVKISFRKVKIPSGGMVQFELPSDDPNNPDYAKSLEGVILYSHPVNTFWPAGTEYDDSVTPLCSSMDGKWGEGSPGGVCETCELIRYNTDPKGGKGKACKNQRALYILRNEEYVPICLTLPPTSLTPFQDFLNVGFISYRRPIFSSLVEIGLKKVSNGTNEYSVATFKRVYDFMGEELQNIRAYANNFREMLKKSLQERAALNREQHGTDCDYTVAEDCRTA